MHKPMVGYSGWMVHQSSVEGRLQHLLRGESAPRQFTTTELREMMTPKVSIIIFLKIFFFLSYDVFSEDKFTF